MISYLQIFDAFYGRIRWAAVMRLGDGTDRFLHWLGY
jgi:hypothetical protein